MLPYVKISFANGTLGTVTPSEDGVVGIFGEATAEASKFALNTAYRVYSMKEVSDIITETANAGLYKACAAFYSEAGDGSELWIWGVAKIQESSTDKTLVNILDTTKKDQAYSVANFLMAANGRINMLVSYDTSTDKAAALLEKANSMAEWATTTLYAPCVVLLNAKNTDNTLTAINTLTYNRVGVVVGMKGTGANAVPGSMLVAGRFARTSVNIHVGRVKDGAITQEEMRHNSAVINNTKAEACNTAGYITFRQFVGRSGYFISDDMLACPVSDDYNSLARRRTIDKAFRIAYGVLIGHVNDEVPVTNEGKPSPQFMKSWEAEVVSAIYNSMTVSGELGVDPDDDTDKGVRCSIDTNVNILATNKVVMSIQVKPYGYAKYIEAEIGFLVEK